MRRLTAGIALLGLALVGAAAIAFDGARKSKARRDAEAVPWPPWRTTFLNELFPGREWGTRRESLRWLNITRRDRPSDDDGADCVCLYEPVAEVVATIFPCEERRVIAWSWLYINQDVAIASPFATSRPRSLVKGAPLSVDELLDMTPAYARFVRTDGVFDIYADWYGAINARRPRWSCVISDGIVTKVP